MSDLWLMEYEQISDDYTADCQKTGIPEAVGRVRRRLKALGFDPAEIDEHVTAIVS
jgi:hypothetical protein